MNTMGDIGPSPVLKLAAPSPLLTLERRGLPLLLLAWLAHPMPSNKEERQRVSRASHEERLRRHGPWRSINHRGDDVVQERLRRHPMPEQVPKPHGYGALQRWEHLVYHHKLMLRAYLKLVFY